MTSLRAERDRAAAEERRGRLRIGLAAGVVVVAVAGLLALAGGRPVPPGRSAYDAGTTDPVAAAVPVLAGFAEQARELRFRTPPRVEVVEPAAFARVRAELLPAAEGAGDRVATTRALGLAPAAAAETSPAHYSYPRHTVYVRRGTAFDAYARVVLLRELTRALQDQSFDVLRLLRAAGADGDRARALAALVEGDARRVEAAYVATLPTADRAAVQRLGPPAPRAYGELERSFPATVGRRRSRPRWPSTGATRRWTGRSPGRRCRPRRSSTRANTWPAPSRWVCGRRRARGGGSTRGRSASSGWRHWSPEAGGCSTSAPPATGSATATAPSGRPAGCARTAT